MLGPTDPSCAVCNCETPRLCPDLMSDSDQEMHRLMDAIVFPALTQFMKPGKLDSANGQMLTLNSQSERSLCQFKSAL